MPRATDPKTTVRWTAEEYERLKEASDALDVAVGAIVRECVARALTDVERTARRNGPRGRAANSVPAEGKFTEVVADASAVIGIPENPIVTARKLQAQRVAALRAQQQR